MALSDIRRIARESSALPRKVWTSREPAQMVAGIEPSTGGAAG